MRVAHHVDLTYQLALFHIDALRGGFFGQASLIGKSSRSSQTGRPARNRTCRDRRGNAARVSAVVVKPADSCSSGSM
jgi:hypothetical protein